jgi:hypothetical protein
MNPDQLLEYRQEYGVIYGCTILGVDFIWRPITRKEYKDICSLPIDEAEVEELICRKCVLVPAESSFNDPEGLAGIPSALAERIIQTSGLDPKSIKQLLNLYRSGISNFEAQMDLVIFEGFSGKYSLEEIKAWPMEKSVAMFAQAEWILTTLRGVPLQTEDDDGMPPELRDPNKL